MIEITAQAIQIIGAFLSGFLLGGIAGWFVRQYHSDDTLKPRRVTRVIMGIAIMAVWTTAAFASIFTGFNIPIYFHVFAGFVLVPVFDPSGNTIDKLLQIFN